MRSSDLGVPERIGRMPRGPGMGPLAQMLDHVPLCVQQVMQHGEVVVVDDHRNLSTQASDARLGQAIDRDDQLTIENMRRGRSRKVAARAPYLTRSD